MRMNKIACSLTAMFLIGTAATVELAAAMPADRLKVANYAKSGPWTLRKATAGGKVQSCDAFQMTASETGIRYEYNLDSSSISFSGLASAADDKPMQVEVWFDNNRAEAQTYTMTLEPDAKGYDWRTLREANDEPHAWEDQFSNLSKIHFVYTVKGEGRHEEVFVLAGSNGVYKKTIACVQNAH
ncbi:MAG: hypothetical protein WDN08_20520 [Rhizomicrobium sp.]